tara:strand:- start:314 stop:607 length:294 start_codon:yes stop_codon:yes gene_type:complete
MKPTTNYIENQIKTEKSRRKPQKNIIKEEGEYLTLPPSNIHQAQFRRMIDERHSNIREPHCKICGDTEEEETLIELTTNEGIQYLCKTCHGIQKRMT